MRAWAVSDKGKIRNDNQDSFRLRELPNGGFLAVVCDGMGGANAGNVASAKASDVFVDAVEKRFAQAPPEEILPEAASAANEAVFTMAEYEPRYEGMGTTLVALLVWDGKAWLANVGDSRAYCVRDNAICLVTKDHSVVQELVDMGKLTPEEAQHYPKRNLITRAVGTDAELECDVFRMEARPGDGFLLCSDGLSNLLRREEMLNMFRREENPVQLCRWLVEEALLRGAPDNVTALVVKI